MSFQGHLCWKPEDVDTLLNVEVEQFSDELFLATHTPLKPRRVRYYPPQGERGMGSLEAADPIPENKILDEFLRPDTFAFLPVLGQAGTGKTHLIRWLSTQIPSTPTRRVVRIPRVGISLRGVIERIIEGIEGPKFDDVRQKLARAREGMTHAAAREMLLATLSVTVGPNGPPATRAATQLEKLVEQGLPKLFSDNFFKEYLLKPDGYVDRVALHVVTGSKVVDRRERPMAFSSDDLPLSLVNVQQNAGKAARDFYQQLTALPNVQEVAIEWINRHLPEAIRLVLNLGGADLRTLMTEARQELARKNIELVLLIEDFARMQGIEMELLDALTIQSHQTNEAPLCSMRTALACNLGYYETIPETAKQRATLHITMDDAGTNVGGGISPNDVERFVSRYLNAIRLGPRRLHEWHSGNQTHDDSKPLDSACQTCTYRDTCHAAFGDCDGIGLYPLNSVTVDRARERISKNVFVPREMLKQGLRPFLETYAPDLPDGRFPSMALSRAMFGPSVKAEVIADLERNGGVNGNRYVALVDLWSERQNLSDVVPDIYHAFKLPGLKAPHSPPPTSTPPPPVVDKIEKTTTKAPQGPESDPEDADLKALDEWAAKTSKLTQTLAQTLRTEVFRAIVAEIDWSGELLQESVFAQETSGIFRKTSIVFEDSLHSDTAAHGVHLRLPLAGQRPQTAVALKNLLLRKSNHNWSFSGGDQAYRIVASQVRQWATEVLNQLRRIPTKDGPWDIIPVAVELLTFGQFLMGRTPDNDSDGALMEFILQPFDGCITRARAEAWRNAAAPFGQHGTAIRNLVLGCTACVKGDGQAFMLDSARILPYIRNSIATGHCSKSPPGQLPPALAPISSTHSKVNRLLSDAVDNETNAWVAWGAKVDNLIGEKPDPSGFKDDLLSAFDSAQSAGHVGGDTSVHELRTVIKNLDIEGLSTVMQRTHDILNASDAGNRFRALASADPGVRDDFDRHLSLLEQSLAQTRNKLQYQIDANATAVGLNQAVTDVISHLDDLSTLCNKSTEATQ